MIHGVEMTCRTYCTWHDVYALSAVCCMAYNLRCMVSAMAVVEFCGHSGITYAVNWCRKCITGHAIDAGSWLFKSMVCDLCHTLCCMRDCVLCITWHVVNDALCVVQLCSSIYIDMLNVGCRMLDVTFEDGCFVMCCMMRIIMMSNCI